MASDEKKFGKNAPGFFCPMSPTGPIRAMLLFSVALIYALVGSIRYSRSVSKLNMEYSGTSIDSRDICFVVRVLFNLR